MEVDLGLAFGELRLGVGGKELQKLVLDRTGSLVLLTSTRMKKMNCSYNNSGIVNLIID